MRPRFWPLEGVAVLLSGVMVWGNFAFAEAKPPAEGHGSAKDKAPKSEPKEPAEENPELAARASQTYQHGWEPFPSFAGLRLGGGTGAIEVRPVKGRVLVVVFLASWCEPCQQLMEPLRKLEQRYKEIYTDFHYVFTHDTRDDALGFMSEFSMPRGILANQDILKTFKNPKLPTIYVGDRYGWLVSGHIEANKKSLTDLDHLLRYLTAL